MLGREVQSPSLRLQGSQSAAPISENRGCGSPMPQACRPHTKETPFPVPCCCVLALLFPLPGMLFPTLWVSLELQLLGKEP